ncbi:MAG: hypothetical protein ABI844_18470 [Saprospiraceae bacterium]
MSQFLVQGVSSPHFLVLPEDRFSSPSTQNFRVALSGVAKFLPEFYIASTLNIQRVSIMDYLMSMDAVVNRAKPLLPPLVDGTEYKFVPIQWTIMASANAMWKMSSPRFGGTITTGWRIIRDDKTVHATNQVVKTFRGIEVDLSIIFSADLKIGYNIEMYGYFSIVNYPIIT